jgi:hypothetical protein
MTGPLSGDRWLFLSICTATRSMGAQRRQAAAGKAVRADAGPRAFPHVNFAGETEARRVPEGQLGGRRSIGRERDAFRRSIRQ